jgi:hypothetical protein
VKVNLGLFAAGTIGINFRHNEPDFSPFAIATVRLKDYRVERYGSEGTMPEADKILVRRHIGQ